MKNIVEIHKHMLNCVAMKKDTKDTSAFNDDVMGMQ
jgi:hypothetical protein